MAVRRPQHGAHEGHARVNPRLAADIGMGVAGLVLIPLICVAGAALIIPTPEQEYPGIHMSGYAETKEMVLSFEAASAQIERCEFLYRENYQNVFLARFERLAQDLSEPERMRLADKEWQRARHVLRHVASRYQKVKQSIDKRQDPRLESLRSTVEPRLQQLLEEQQKFEGRAPFIR